MAGRVPVPTLTGVRRMLTPRFQISENPKATTAHP